ncbi:MAG: transaldolase [Caulobacteraceae bacterium]|nr:transaldolase [Caulobacteraceae bacterium]
MSNSLRDLAAAGQAVWLDYLHRRILEDGELSRLIEADCVTGLTSNPAIFQKAIGDSENYDGALANLIAEADGEVVDLYERLAVADIQAAADQLRPLWSRRGGRDGFVSLEVSPHLAHDTEGTLTEARRLWRSVDRPNLMIKVPGMPAGVPAIRALIGEGINVNVTLLFSVEAYLAVAEAHVAGLEDRRAAGGDVSTVHGVASFFVSRIDGVMDPRIDRRLGEASPDEAAALRRLRGRLAIANAKVAYQRYLALVSTPRWQALAAAGAAPQRLLWASTGTKDPAYSDVLYVESLIGPDTVDTMPPATMDAFRDHGVARRTLTEAADEAEGVLAEADRLGLDLPGATEFLALDGVDKFVQAFDDLLGAVAAKRQAILGARLGAQSIAAGALEPSLDAALARMASEGWARRLWGRDASLWPGGEAARWLGWLDAASGTAVDLVDLEAFGQAVAERRFAHAVLLGMGGSSLGPEVLAETFGAAPGRPGLLVLDSTDPGQVARVAAQIDPARTLFIVASKSGSTLEPDILHRYFFELAERALGAEGAGERFIAITDPRSKLEETARRQGFWRIFPGRPDVGGRYSVLSNFGMVPAAVLGLDVRAIFESVAMMARTCGASAPPLANPAFALGALMGVAAEAGRDKLTLIADEGLADFGAWLEQLVAESTGKQGKGVIPIDGEPLQPVAAYGADRLFVRLRLAPSSDAAKGDAGKDAAADALEAAGHPLARIQVAGREGLFQEFLRWELATAVAGAVIGIDPFDQPDVEASKVRTRALTDAYEAAGATAPETPRLISGALRLFTDDANAAALRAAAPSATLEDWLAAHLRRAGAGDYIALLAYLDRNTGHIAVLRTLRERLGRASPAATVLQFGPRFLHSTGQAYKGGPNSGVFLQITARPAADLQVPGRGLTFGVVEAAQARGDFEVLAERGRRVLRVDLGDDVEGGLAQLASALAPVLG